MDVMLGRTTTENEMPGPGMPAGTFRGERAVADGEAMVGIHGFCDERFEPLAALFGVHQESGLDEGASLAVSLGGELVVDLWAGSFDWERARPWERDTLVRVFSTSKVVLAILTWMVHDRGLLDLHAPVADYWPEFDRHGKGVMTAHQILTHQSGLPGFGRRIAFDELCDGDRMIALLEDAELWFEPGSRGYYQPFTLGFLLGEVIQRVTGRRYEEFFRNELGDPLGLDFHYTMTDDDFEHRVAPVWPPEIATAQQEDPTMTEIDSTWWILPDSRRVCMPASSGVANGRTIARLGEMVASGGEVGGRRYLSREVIDLARAEHAYLEDPMFGMIRWGLGLAIDHPDFRAVTPDSMHWGGFGGSYASMDPVRGLSIGFAPSKLRVSEESAIEEERLLGLQQTLMSCVRGLD